MISGEVISISDVPDGSWWDNLYVAEIRVSECWKGSYGRGDTVLIRTGDSRVYCGYPFQVGTSYLVFGYSKEGALHTSICDPTTSSVDWGASQLGEPGCTTAVERGTWAHVKRLFK